MAHLSKFPGLDLDVYDPETPVAWTYEQLQSKGNVGPLEGETTFVRGVWLEYSGTERLMTVLDLADRLLPEAAEAIGAVAIKPVWALHKMPETGDLPLGKMPDENAYTHDEDDLIPDGYALVAAVPYILKPHQPDIDSLILIEGLARAYYSKKLRNNEPAIRDISWGQVALGALTGDSEEKLRLFDIEPRIILGIHDLIRTMTVPLQASGR